MSDLFPAPFAALLSADAVEFAATILTVACILLGTARSLWQYPVGVASTILFFFVVYGARLYANAGLQVFFLAMQFYGWLYWLRGGPERRKPRITDFGFGRTALWTVITIMLSLGGGLILNRFTQAAMASLDAVVFGLSVLAQFMLDRKKVENWIVWGVVNAGSVWLYASRGLWMFAALYIALFVNCFVAWWLWRREQRSYLPGDLPLDAALGRAETVVVSPIEKLEASL